MCRAASERADGQRKVGRSERAVEGCVAADQRGAGADELAAGIEVALLPVKLIVPVCVSMMPLLTKAIAPIVVVSRPPLLRKAPLLLKVGVAPPLLTSVLLLLRPTPTGC